MYTLGEYIGMVTDDGRTAPYVQAIRESVRPDSVVLEIGTGIGFFAVAACMAGARRVYAIESDPSILVARELARANGCEDRIVFIDGASFDASTEPADVLISDLRGVLPWHGTHIPSIVDARVRLLKPEAIQIPARDSLHAALVELPAHAAASRIAAVEQRYGVSLATAQHRLDGSWRKQRLASGDLMTDAGTWQVIDYRTVVEPSAEGTTVVRAARAGTATAIAAWFDTELFEGVGFSNAPYAPPALYGQAVFPLPEPLPLHEGDAVAITIGATLAGSDYVWRWSAEVRSGSLKGRRIEQSDFFLMPQLAAGLRKRASNFVPMLGRRGTAQAWILAALSESRSLGDVAREAASRFPDLYPDADRALAAVADASQEFST